MDNYYLKRIMHTNDKLVKELDILLHSENIKRDSNLDYTVGLFNEDNKLIATGSTYGNTIRCLAVNKSFQGEGLLNKIVNNLIEYQIHIGNTHLFLYTKSEKKQFFESLGFYKVAEAENNVLFMENRKTGFQDYIKSINTAYGKESTALVMNCNPFTLGHQYLLEYVANKNDIVHLFIVSEDKSLFSFEDRFKMVKDGCAHLNNIYIHETNSYMISNSVFPSYFFKDDEDSIKAHTNLDIEIFIKISRELNITSRYVGDEPFSKVTKIYNNVMEKKLPANCIKCIIVKRKDYNGQPISASFVRKCIYDGDIEEIKKFVPQSTYKYFFTEKGKETVRKIQQSLDIIHY